MNKEQKQLIIVGILVIILLAFSYNGYLSISKNNRKGQGPSGKPVPAKKSVKAAVPQVTVDRGDATKIAAQKTRTGQWGRDPFGTSGTKQEERLDSFSLQGITLGNGTAFAFINNMILRKGESLGDYQLVEIQRDKVLLQRGEQKFYLKFPDEKK